MFKPFTTSRALRVALLFVSIVALLFVSIVALPFVLAVPALAQGGPPGMGGPAKVVVGAARDGVLSPQAEYRGTVFFKEVSDVATEVNGKVIARPPANARGCWRYALHSVGVPARRP